MKTFHVNPNHLVNDEDGRLGALLARLESFFAGQIEVNEIIEVVCTSERAELVVGQIIAEALTPVAAPEIEVMHLPIVVQELAAGNNAPIAAVEQAAEAAAGAGPQAAILPLRKTARQPEIKICEECEKEFPAPRKDSRFCSKACRNKHDHKRAKAAPRQTLDWKVEKTGEELKHRDFSERLHAGRYNVGDLVHHRKRGDYRVTVGAGYKFTLERVRA